MCTVPDACVVYVPGCPNRTRPEYYMKLALALALALDATAGDCHSFTTFFSQLCTGVRPKYSSVQLKVQFIATDAVVRR